MILTIFPESIRPKYISFESVDENTDIFIKRSLFISITTPIQDLYKSIDESLLVRKTAYRYFNIPEVIEVPRKMLVVYIAREGKTRQITNEVALLDSLRNISDQIVIKKKYLSGLSFRQQVEMMSNTDIVFGIHGAGFTNILFLRPKSGLIEFFAPNFLRVYYKNMAMKSLIFYNLVRDNNATIDVEQSELFKDPRNANLEINISSMVNVFSTMIGDVQIEKFGF